MVLETGSRSGGEMVGSESLRRVKDDFVWGRVGEGRLKLAAEGEVEEVEDERAGCERSEGGMGAEVTVGWKREKGG
jgi:hypothetical protein